MRGAIEHVIFSTDIRDALIARGRERTKRFSWERCAAETMELYREGMQAMKLSDVDSHRSGIFGSGILECCSGN